jgi:UDP-N-acetylglucosamine 2-epimerase (non-hydrolysing)
MRIAHIEAGMRSGDLRNPFPEEINRRLVSRWTDYHFAPEEENAAHLRRENHGGQIYVTGGNSVYDAMISTLKMPRPSDLPTGEYVLANLHRFENLQNSERWRGLMESLLQAQKLAPVYFVMHPPTESRLMQDPQAQEKLKAAGVQLLGRQSYSRFVHLLAGARFVLTDGGSNQTECAYLGLPCLVMREKTELADGIGKNCILSRFASEIMADFFQNPEKYKHPMLHLEQSPSQKIIQALRELPS